MAIFRLSCLKISPGFLAALSCVLLCAGRLYAAPLEGGLAAAAPDEARSRVLAAAETYEHTPYRYGGVDRRGLDCSGFVYVSFYDALGVSLPRNTGGLYSWSEKITMEEAYPGDLVFFKTTGNGTISHVGIFLGNGRFIHSASEGPATGVIYSSLDERYWSRTFAGMGRVLPETDAYISGSAKDGADGKKATKKKPSTKEKKQKKEQKEASNLLIGAAVAPTWNTYTLDYSAVRGVAGQLSVGTVILPFGHQMLLSMELRPEWDGMLGVFRVPLTFSWGFSDKLRFFAGPALSFGDASLVVLGKDRKYTGGTAWFGAAGITIAPFKINISGNNLAPYGELAWQSYYHSGSNTNINADIVAGIRFSTGLRYTWRKQ